MKKILSTVAAAAVLATSSFALDTDKLYVGAGLGIESVTGFDSGMAMVLTAGLPVTEKGESGPGTLAVEAETTFDLTAPSVGDLEASIFTLAAYAAYKYDINEKAYVKPRLGLLYESVTMEATIFGQTVSADSTDFGLAMGVQAGYNIDEKLDVVVGYNIIEADVSQLTVGVLYRY